MRTVQQMISQEVLVCLSSLVSTLAGGYGCRYEARDVGDLTDQAFNLASPVLDYEEAAREAGWTLDDGPAGCGRLIHADHRSTWAEDAWNEVCEEYDIEPHEREVFEHWAVTDWFVEKLEAAGEKVDRDFAGMCVWARTTTGQAIYMDAVIERIHAECAKSVEG